MSGIYEEAVLREVIAEAYKTGGVHLNIGVARAIARAAIAAMPSWRPIETAPKGRDNIELWHKFWKCTITASWHPEYRSECPWLEATKTNTWPEEAFSYWRPVSAPPKPEGGQA